jgi:hypothetical protein
MGIAKMLMKARRRRPSSFEFMLVETCRITADRNLSS